MLLGPYFRQGIVLVRWHSTQAVLCPPELAGRGVETWSYVCVGIVSALERNWQRTRSQRAVCCHQVLRRRRSICSWAYRKQRVAGRGREERRFRRQVQQTWMPSQMIPDEPHNLVFPKLFHKPPETVAVQSCLPQANVPWELHLNLQAVFASHSTTRVVHFNIKAMAFLLQIL